MVMREEDIIKNYLESKFPAKQVAVLADLNCCKPDEIADILRRANVLKKTEKKQREQKTEKPDEKSAYKLVYNSLAMKVNRLLDDISENEETVNRLMDEQFLFREELKEASAARAYIAKMLGIKEEVIKNEKK